MDVVLVHGVGGGQDSMLCMGDGTGALSCTTPFAAISDDVWTVSVGYMNDDDHLDVLWGTAGSSVKMSPGEACTGMTCTFAAEISLPTSTARCSKIAVGDLDNDGETYRILTQPCCLEPKMSKSVKIEGRMFQFPLSRRQIGSGHGLLGGRFSRKSREAHWGWRRWLHR